MNSLHDMRSDDCIVAYGFATHEFSAEAHLPFVANTLQMTGSLLKFLGSSAMACLWFSPSEPDEQSSHIIIWLWMCWSISSLIEPAQHMLSSCSHVEENVSEQYIWHPVACHTISCSQASTTNFSMSYSSLCLLPILLRMVAPSCWEWLPRLVDNQESHESLFPPAWAGPAEFSGLNQPCQTVAVLGVQKIKTIYLVHRQAAWVSRPGTLLGFQQLKVMRKKCDTWLDNLINGFQSELLTEITCTRYDLSSNVSVPWATAHGSYDLLHSLFLQADWEITGQS